MAAPLPPIPQITGDLMLDVYTHRTLIFEGAPAREHGDNERLALLGEQILDMAVTFALYLKRPMLSAPDIAAQRAEICSDANVESWIAAYGLRKRLRYAPDAADEIKTPKEAHILLNSYIGAAYIQSGLAPIQEWLSRLVNPDAEPPSLPSPPINAYTNGSSPPPQPTTAPPPIPQSGGPGSLALFNQTAAQRGLLVVYNPESVGPSHAPRWTVKCVVDGVERGVGIGRNQKLAKEDAARQAMRSLGWAL